MIGSRLILLRRQLNSWGFTFFVSEEEGVFQSVEKEGTDSWPSVLGIEKFLVVELDFNEIFGWFLAVDIKVVSKVRLKRGVRWAKRNLFARRNLHFSFFAVLTLHFNSPIIIITQEKFYQQILAYSFIFCFRLPFFKFSFTSPQNRLFLKITFFITVHGDFYLFFS